MGLYRTALRLATLEALRPTGLLSQQGVAWPTLAQANVFDSRIDPIEDLTAERHKAAIVVYTPGDIGYGSQHRGGPPFRRVVELCFEISQIAMAPSDEDPQTYTAGIPQTDPELEAELDRIEAEIGFALLHAPSGKIWRQLTGSMVTDPRSNGRRDSEEGVRLALHEMTWHVQVPDNQFEGLPLQPLLGIDRLPQPLRGVAEQLMASSYGATIAAALGLTMPTMPAPTPLKQIGLGVEVVLPGRTSTGAPDIKGTVTLQGVGPQPAKPPHDSNPG